MLFFAKIKRKKAKKSPGTMAACCSPGSFCIAGGSSVLCCGHSSGTFPARRAFPKDTASVIISFILSPFGMLCVNRHKTSPFGEVRRLEKRRRAQIDGCS